jgi:hypothetical protein
LDVALPVESGLAKEDKKKPEPQGLGFRELSSACPNYTWIMNWAATNVNVTEGSLLS